MNFESASSTRAGAPVRGLLPRMVLPNPLSKDIASFGSDTHALQYLPRAGNRTLRWRDISTPRPGHSQAIIRHAGFANPIAEPSVQRSRCASTLTGNMKRWREPDPEKP